MGKALESVDQDTRERDLVAMARNQVDVQASYQLSRSLRAVPHSPRVVQLGACYLAAVLVAHPLVHLPVEPGERH